MEKWTFSATSQLWYEIKNNSRKVFIILTYVPYKA
jgi:hypothetical protein